MAPNQQNIIFGNKSLFLSSFYNCLYGKDEIIQFANPASKDFFPFPGIRPFKLSEANLFFGRDDEIVKVIEKLGKNQLIVLHSNMEEGKSSFIQAGLIPSLMSGDMPQRGIQWKFALSTPGYTPIENLVLSLCKSALKKQENSNLKIELAKIIEPNGEINIKRIIQYFVALQNYYQSNNENLLIVIDQLEEVFLEDQKDGVAEFFLMLIAKLFLKKNKNTFFVLSCDSRSLNQCNPLFSDLTSLNYSLHLLPKMEKAQAISAINGPLKYIGKSVSPSLLRTILADISLESSPLPVLQFILTQLTLNSQNKIIDYPSYFKIGGIEKCFDIYINNLVGIIPFEDKKNIKNIFSLFPTTISYGKKYFSLSILNKCNEKEQTEIVKLLVLLEAKNLIKRIPNIQKISMSSICVEEKSSLIKSWCQEPSFLTSSNLKGHKFS